MIVVDTNIIAAFYLPTTYSKKAGDLYKYESQWTAPLLWKSEFRNVLALYMRKKLVTLEQALQIQEAAESLLANNEFEIPSSRLLPLIQKSACSGYDCEFVVLADQLGTRLVTQDKQVIKTFPKIALSILAFLLSAT
ncbi:type II toxin-antitoxin system VapC family toxin [Nitrospira defluvii]|nr:type II toxin-antitoxin system VapC family toxin [Nitrospira defluvii]